MEVVDSIAEVSLNAPLLRCPHLCSGTGAEVLFKYEGLNPGGSLKDRAIASMLGHAISVGQIGTETLIIEASAGNAAISLALACASKGLRALLVMPESTPPVFVKLIEALGARVELVPGNMNDAVAHASKIHESEEDSFFLDQFSNPHNPLAYERGLAKEIWRQSDGTVDYLVVGVGTGGTLTGTARFLKRQKNEIVVIAVEPSGSPVLSGGRPGRHGIRGLGAGFVPRVLDLYLIDETIRISDEEAARTAWKLRSLEGIPAGISSGAVAAACLAVARRTEAEGKTIVGILPSSMWVEWIVVAEGQGERGK